MFGDDLAVVVAGLLGGLAITTYGENTGGLLLQKFIAQEFYVLQHFLGLFLIRFLNRYLIRIQLHDKGLILSI